MSTIQGEALKQPAREQGRGLVRRLFSSLRVRLVTLVLLAMVPALLMILYSAWEDRREASDQVREDTVTLTQLAVIQQQQLIEGSRQVMVSLSPLAAAVDFDTIDAQGCGSLLGSMLEQLSFYANFGLARTNGQVACSAAGFGIEPPDISDRTSFRSAVGSGEFAVGQYLDDPLTNLGVLDMTLPLKDVEGTLTGVLFLDLSLDRLNELVAGVNLPEDSVFMIIDGSGTVLARYPDPEGFVGRPDPANPVTQRIVEQGEGTEELTSASGTTRLYGFTQITEPVPTDLYATVGIPRSAAFASVNEDLSRNMMGIGLVAVLVIGAAWLGGEFFVIRPTRRLVTATGLVSGGDLSTRTGIDRDGGELGELAAAFDDMALSLEARAADQRRAEDELRRLNESLEQRVAERTAEAERRAQELSRSNAELEDFTYVVSHDLKEPLRGIEAFSGFLAEDYSDQLDGEARRYIQVIRNSSLQMKSLIEDLLELSREGRQTPTYAETSIDGLVRETLDDLRFAISGRPTEVRVADDLPRIVCDGTRLKEVFKNLISNALKFNDREDRLVAVNWRDIGDRYRFEVRDNGIGIEPAYREKIFQIFQRLHRREDYPGTGAGLTICKKIVESHGGEIGVDSAPGEGATFWFMIPKDIQPDKGKGGAGE